MMSKKTLTIATLLLIMFGCSGQKGKPAQSDEDVFEEVTDTLTYPDDAITVDREQVNICVSDDERLRIYCWDTGEGGTIRDIAIVYQFRTDDGEKRLIRKGREEGSFNPWILRIYTITKSDGSTYYIVRSIFYASRNDAMESLDAYAIKGDSLVEVAVLDGGPDVDFRSMPSVNYSVNDCGSTTGGEGFSWIYEYDEQKIDFYVPIVADVDLTQPPFLIDRYVLYHFDGKSFINMGEVPHRDLHPSLHQYYRLRCLFRTNDYTVRIDQMADSTLRYASWKADCSMSDKPELVIMGGRFTPDEEGITGGTYTFLNEGVEYTVGRIETPHESDDYDSYQEYLIVKRGNTILLKQERL